MLYSFTNRRRAKDVIMLIIDKFGTNSMMVFVRDGVIYVEVSAIPDIDVIMHYAEKSQDSIDKLLGLDAITELYKGDGIRKFRV